MTDASPSRALTPPPLAASLLDLRPLLGALAIGLALLGAVVGGVGADALLARTGPGAPSAALPTCLAILALALVMVCAGARGLDRRWQLVAATLVAALCLDRLVEALVTQGTDLSWRSMASHLADWADPVLPGRMGTETALIALFLALALVARKSAPRVGLPLALCAGFLMVNDLVAKSLGFVLFEAFLGSWAGLGLLPLGLGVIALYGSSRLLRPLLATGKIGAATRIGVIAAGAVPWVMVLVLVRGRGIEDFGPDAVPFVTGTMAALQFVALRIGHLLTDGSQPAAGEDPATASGFRKLAAAAAGAEGDRWLILLIGGLVRKAGDGRHDAEREALLATVEQTVTGVLRRCDQVGRVDEGVLFAAVRISHQDEPVTICERLRNAVLGPRADDDGAGATRPTSVSIGFSRHAGPLHTSAEPAERAHKALRLAMAEGRNRIVDGDRLTHILPDTLRVA